MSSPSDHRATAPRVETLDRLAWTYLLPAALFAAATLLYLSTLTSLYAFDGLAYVSFTIRALVQGEITALFYVAHLAWGPVTYVMALATGGPGGPVPLYVRTQILNAVLGGVTVSALFLVLRRWVRRDAALGACVAAALTYSMWHFATDLEVYVLASLLVVISLGPALRLFEAPSAARALIAGATAGLAALGHATHALFGAATVAALLLRRGHPGRLRLAGLFVLAAAVVSGGAVLAVMLGPRAGMGGEAQTGFLLSYARAPQGYVNLAWENLLQDVLAVARTVAGPESGWDRPALSILAVVLTVGLWLIGLVGGFRSSVPLAPLALSWHVAHAGFFTLWDAGNPELWVITIVPGLALVAVGLDRLTRTWPRAARTGSLTLLPILLVAANEPRIRREMAPDFNRPLANAELISRSTPPDAVVLVCGLGSWAELRLYLPLFGARRTVSLRDYLAEPDSLVRLERDLAHRDYPIFALSELVGRDTCRAGLEEYTGLPAGSLDRALPDARFVRRGAVGDLVLYELAGRADPAP